MSQSIQSDRYSLFLLDEVILFQKDDTNWRTVPIFGEQSNRLTYPQAAATIISELNDHINSQQELSNIELYIIYDKNSSEQLVPLASKLQALQCNNWQLLSWQPLWQKAITIKPNNNEKEKCSKFQVNKNMDWLLQTVLPLMDSLFGFESVPLQFQQDSEQTMQTTVKQNYGDVIAQLNAEKTKLQNTVNRLQQQAVTLNTSSVEKLTTFLPVIYRNFWNTVKPTDLGLLVGTYQMPEIPSPFPEPTADTISMMRKQFLALPESDKDKIIQFCQQMTHPVQIRPEFQSVIEG